MISNTIPPAIIFILGGLILPFVRVRRIKQALQLLIPAVAFLELVFMQPGTYWVYNFLGYDLVFGRLDKLSLCFGYVFVIITFIGMIYALHVEEDGQHVAAFLYGGSTLGVVFAGDLFSLFAFWEIMAVSSVFLIWYNKKKQALDAGFRYIMIHIFGGCALLVGVILHVYDTGSIAFDLMNIGSAGGKWILIGFMVNAAVPPLHAWLSDAYPEGTITGSVFLAAFTTKSAVYVLLRGFLGTEVLIWFGAVMALYGVIYAILENDIRRILAFSIISQIGYMVVGVGLGSDLALNGATAHAFCHILYKALLFMCTGAVIYVTGKRKITDLCGRDLYKKMPITLSLYMVGAFSIAAVPLFNGFISKPMIIAAAGMEHKMAVHLMLHLASMGTFLYICMRLPYGVWFGKSREKEPFCDFEAKEPPLNMLIAMGLGALACIVTGAYPELLYKLLPNAVDYHPYTGTHIFNTLQMVFAGAIVFWLMRSWVEARNTISIDLDWFYRIPGRLFFRFCDGPLNYLRDAVKNLFSETTAFVSSLTKNPFTAIEVISLTGRVNAMPEGKGRKLAEKRLQDLRSKYYNEDLYRTPIGWSVLVSILLVFVFSVVYFIYSA